jgi:hypothetical protein
LSLDLHQHLSLTQTDILEALLATTCFNQPPRKMRSATSFTIGAAIACGLGAAPGASLCITGNASALQQAYYPETANCAEFMIPVTFQSDNSVFDFPQWANNYDLEDFLAVATTRAGADYPSLVTASESQQVTRQIAASFCTPKNTTKGKESTVILATHGIGQARSHWYVPMLPKSLSRIRYIDRP